MELHNHLQRLESEGAPILVGLVGCGQMGSGLVHVTNQMAGMKTVIIADIDTKRPIKTFKKLGLSEDEICVTDDVGPAADAIRSGKVVVTEDALLLSKIDDVDIVVEATGYTEIGAKVAWHCIMNQKHVVMLNVETDVTVGIYLNELAKKVGCVYTVASGDEPGVCKMLYNFATSLGFETVCLGKGKNNVIDYYATPSTCEEEALSKGMNPKMLAAFKDGTKTMVELAAMSNATGLVADVPGTHGERVDLDDLNKVLVPADDGGILTRRGCVEYTTGKVAPGVFAIITSHDRRVRVDMKFLAMGDGPYYTLYRPYHLCNIETPISIAEAVIYGETTIVSDNLVAEVVAIAKRDLEPGKIVDDLGGYDFFNRIYRAEEAKALSGMPMGITPGGEVIAPIKKGEIFTYDNFAPDRSRFAYKLRLLQDELLTER